MGRLKYISHSNGGTFSITSMAWINQITSDCVVEYKFLSTSRTDVLDFGAVYSGLNLTKGISLKYMAIWSYLQWYNGTKASITNSIYTLNEPHILTLSGSEYKWDGETIASVSNIQTVNNPTFKPTITGNFYYFKVTKNGTDIINLVPWETNGYLYIKDLVSNNDWSIGGSWTAGPAYSDNNIVPINKYKLYTSNIQKTYNGSTQINKMYVGNNLVYRALPTTITPTTPTNVDYVHTSTPTSTANFINTGVYPTTDTVYRIVYKPNATIDTTLVGFDGGKTPTMCSSDSTDYRYFYYRGLNSVTFDFNSSRINKTITFDSDGYADVTIGNNYITDNLAQSTQTGTTQSTITPNIPIYLNVSSDSDFQSLEIWQNNVKVYDGHAAVLNGTYGVYDSVGGTFTTQTYGGNTMSGGNI